jgi:hypothetical protein
MNLPLPPRLKRYVTKKVRDGVSRTEIDVVREALRLLQEPALFLGYGAKGRAPRFSGPHGPDLGGVPPGNDIEALAFVVLMQATQDMDEDLKTIMAEVKAMTSAKQALRALISKVNKDVASNAGQTNGRRPLHFRAGMGSEKAYHRAPVPFPDAETRGGVGFVRTDLFPGAITDVSQLLAIQDELKGKLDGMNELSEMTSLRLQMSMDRRSKLISTLSNILKKISTTQETLVQNLK